MDDLDEKLKKDTEDAEEEVAEEDVAEDAEESNDEKEEVSN